MQNLFFEVDHRATEDLPFWSCNARGIAFLPHYHSSVEFFFVLCGSVTAELEDGSFVLRGGDLLVVPRLFPAFRRRTGAHGENAVFQRRRADRFFALSRAARRDRRGNGAERRASAFV